MTFSGIGNTFKLSCLHGAMVTSYSVVSGPSSQEILLTIDRSWWGKLAVLLYEEGWSQINTPATYPPFSRGGRALIFQDSVAGFIHEKIHDLDQLPGAPLTESESLTSTPVQPAGYKHTTVPAYATRTYTASSTTRFHQANIPHGQCNI